MRDRRSEWYIVSDACVIAGPFATAEDARTAGREIAPESRRAAGIRLRCITDECVDDATAEASHG